MFSRSRIAQRWARVLNRWYARKIGFSKPATAFRSQPEPRTIGSFAKGRQLCAGNIMFAGHLIQSPNPKLWDVDAPDADFDHARHGFDWLDDLASVGDGHARETAQNWLWGWIDRYGRGGGPGWEPDLTGRRLIRWINHAIFLLRGQGQAESEAFFRSLAQQSHFLGHRWRSTSPGLPRFEALTGLLYSGLALEGMEDFVAPALEGLARECDSQVDAQGGIPTRNPEELLEVFTLLSWAATALGEAGRAPSQAHWGAIERIAPTLRSLRHSDGGLARFHGGGRGLEGRLDSALAASGIRGKSAEGLAMGYARMTAGRTSIVIDASAPPAGAASGNAHASTLAFELTSGRRPLIVSCGAGDSFGAAWRNAARSTPSHSTLVIADHSAATIGGTEQGEGWLSGGPNTVQVRQDRVEDGLRFQGAHDGYVPLFGLTHRRGLSLTVDGRGLAGEDEILTFTEIDKRQFDQSMDAFQLEGVPFSIRFHLHPDVDVALDLGGTAVSMALKSGEVWVFRADQSAGLSVDDSVYLEKHRLNPRATKQIVLSGRALDYATRIRWSLAKAQDTPNSIRDVAMDQDDFDF